MPESENLSSDAVDLLRLASRSSFVTIPLDPTGRSREMRAWALLEAAGLVRPGTIEIDKMRLTFSITEKGLSLTLKETPHA